MKKIDKADYDVESLDARIRSELRLLAREAPAKVQIANHNGPAPSITRRIKFAWGVCLAASVSLLGALVASQWPSSRPEVDAAVDCAAILEFGNADWTPLGEIYRMPLSQGEAMKGILPGCSDSDGSRSPDRSVSVNRAVAFPEVILAEDTVWIRKNADTPVALAPLREPLVCETGGAARVRIESAVSSRPPAFDGDLSKPLEAIVQSDDPVLTAGDWQWVRVSVKIPTSAEVQGSKIYELLSSGAAAQLKYDCAGRIYVAQSLT